MTMTDPIADMLTRVRNGNKAYHETVRMPYSKIKSHIAAAVALLGSLGAFFTASEATMTARSIARVSVDWQVEVQPGASSSTVLDTVRGFPQTRAALPVAFASSSGLSASAQGAVQTTGSGAVVGLPDGYSRTFPGQLRPLVGAPEGVLVAQQTASNLHVAPGDAINVGRTGLPPVSTRVDGVVDLVGQVPRLIGLVFRPIQNGLAQFYALAMALGVTVFLLAIVWKLAW